MDLLLAPVPDRQAAAFIATKPVLARDAFDQLLPDLKARAFVITGVEDANLVQTLRDRIADLPLGASWNDIKADLAAQLSPWLDEGAEDKAEESGVEGSQESGDGGQKSEGGDGETVSPSERRAELLLRTHGFQATSAAQYAVMDRQREVFPSWQYLTMEDDRVRDSHAALDQLVLPADSPFWADHFPPWDWGCRCQVVPLQEEDVADIEAADADKAPEEQRVLDEHRLKEVETTGMLTRALPGQNGLPQRYDLRSPAQRGGSYTFTPGTLKLNADDLKGRYDPETWAGFEKFAKGQALADGGTVWDWFNQEPEVRSQKSGAGAKPKPKPVAKAVPPAAVPPIAPAEPEAESDNVSPVSDALVVKTTAAHAGQIKTAIAAIDRVHDDGALPQIPIVANAGRGASGIYRYPGNRPLNIGVANLDQFWPGLTTAHEIGHFLDHQALGKPGEFASVASPEFAAFRAAVVKTAAYQRLKALGVKAYYFTPEELWARAYAQYIAERSRDPLLLAQVQKVLASIMPDRHWTEADFAPVATAIDGILRAKGWIK